MAKESVIRLGDYTQRLEKLRSLVVSVDFLEFDRMRLFVRRAVANFKHREKFPKGAYERSNFYIGRKVTRLSFFNIYCSVFQMNMLKKALQNEMGTSKYAYFIKGNDLYVYLRDKRKG